MTLHLAFVRSCLPLIGCLAVAAHAVGLEVDTQDRAATVAFYQDTYQASEGVSIDWTPGPTECHPGSTTPALREAILRRVNYFRAMAGVPADVVLDADFNDKAQAAAHLMSVNNQLNHMPPDSWDCWSQDAYDGASRSNLYLGVAGVEAIDGYIRDPGSFNAPLGHRRWILHPTTERIGTGDVPIHAGGRRANSLYVIDGNTFNTPPETRDDAVAWPPAGHVPHDVVYPRWHYATQGVDFSAAQVNVTLAGTTLPVEVEHRNSQYGLGFINWRLDNLNDYASFDRPDADEDYLVEITGATRNGTPVAIAYTVTLIDPTVGPGDFNFDGVVNAADYTVWRDSEGSQTDYTAWQANYGSGSTSSSAANSTAVPEPTTLTLAALLLLSGLGRNARGGFLGQPTTGPAS